MCRGISIDYDMCVQEVDALFVLAIELMYCCGVLVVWDGAQEYCKIVGCRGLILFGQGYNYSSGLCIVCGWCIVL